MPWDEHGVVKIRYKPVQGDAISNSSIGSFRDMMRPCKEAAGTVGDPTATAVS